MLQQELAGATERYQALKAAAGALDFADLLARARDLIRDNADVRAPSAAEVHADLRRRVPGHRSDPGRDPAAARGRRSGRGRSRAGASRSRQAVHRRRSEAGDLPVPRHRRRHLLARAAVRSSGTAAARLQLTTSYRSVPAIQRFVNAAFAPEMTANDGALQADYVPLVASRAGRTIAAGDRRAAGAEAVLGPRRDAQGVGAGRSRTRCPTRSARYIAWLIDPTTRLAGAGTRCRRHASSRVPIQPRHIAMLFRRFVELRRRRHAPVHRRHRGARHPASARRRQGVSRPRRSRDDPRGAGRHRVARRRAVGVRDAEGLAVRHRRRAPARVQAPVRAASIRSGFRRSSAATPARSSRSRAKPTAHLVPIADALRLLQQLHRRRNYRPVADTIGRLLPRRARTSASSCGRPASRRWPTCCTSRSSRGSTRQSGGISFRGFIDELRVGRGDRSGRGADSRREQRRRAADDGAQGQGPRVPGRHPRRPDVPHEPRRRVAAISMPAGDCAR